MKRYQVDIDPDGYRTREHPDGEWVRAEEAEAEIRDLEDWKRTIMQWCEYEQLQKLRAVVDVLPRCEHPRCKQSPNPATWLTFDGWLCDEHENTAPEHQRQQLPYTDALRALTR